MSNTNDPSEIDIARLAYQRYEARGRADGFALEDWLAAEQEARLRQAGISETVETPSPADDASTTTAPTPRRRARDRNASRPGNSATPQVTV